MLATVEKDILKFFSLNSFDDKSINVACKKFNVTQEKKYWRALIELLPEGYRMRATVMLNYEVLANIYKSRKNHKLDEWVEFCKWIESLPYSELITGEEK